MPTHGSESYYVIGEGLLSESVGGRELGEDPPMRRGGRARAAPGRPRPRRRSGSREWARAGCRQAAR